MLESLIIIHLGANEHRNDLLRITSTMYRTQHKKPELTRSLFLSLAVSLFVCSQAPCKHHHIEIILGDLASSQCRSRNVRIYPEHLFRLALSCSADEKPKPNNQNTHTHTPIH